MFNFIDTKRPCHFFTTFWYTQLKIKIQVTDYALNLSVNHRQDYQLLVLYILKWHIDSVYMIVAAR